MKQRTPDYPPAPPSGDPYVLAGGGLMLLSFILHSQESKLDPLVFLLLFAALAASLVAWQATLLLEVDVLKPQLPPIRPAPRERLHFGLGGLVLLVVTLFSATGFAVLPLLYGYNSEGQTVQSSSAVSGFSCGIVALLCWGWLLRRHRRSEWPCAWAGALLLVVLMAAGCTEPRWLVTAFALELLGGGLLVCRRRTVWVRNVIAMQLEATARAVADVKEEPPVAGEDSIPSTS